MTHCQRCGRPGPGSLCPECAATLHSARQGGPGPVGQFDPYASLGTWPPGEPSSHAPGPATPGPDRGNRRVAIGIAVASLVVVAALAGGAVFASSLLRDVPGADPTQAEQASAPTAQPDPTPSGPPSPIAAPTVTVTATATVSAAAVPAGAFPGAGGAAPSGSTPISTVQYGQSAYEPREVAMIKTPSGNIGCDFLMDGDGEITAGCGVASYLSTQQYGGDAVGPNWWIDLSGPAQPGIHSRGDAPYYEFSSVEAQVVEYGSVVTYGDFVCGSASNALTCWNAVTGRGAVMNRAGFTTF